MPLDLARAHPACIHRDNLVIKTSEAGLPLGHDHRLKARLPIPRGLQLEFSEVPLQGFSACPVAAVATVMPGWIVFLKSEMIRKLGLQSSLQQSFGELFQQAVLADDVFRLLVIG